MEKKCFKNIGCVSALGIGTWGIGGGFWTPDYSQDLENEKILKYAIRNGITLIDTAEMYGGGHSEEIVGNAIKGERRDELFIVTKVWNANASYDRVLKSAEMSSKRLGTYIDLYLLHWPSDTVNICETIRAFEELVERGIIRYYGVSNFSVERLEGAMNCQKKFEIVAVENQLSLKNKEDLYNVVEYAKRKGMLYLAYTPIDKGTIANSGILKEVGQKYNRSPVQVALNWLISIQPVVPIPKASNLKHLKENLGAVGWRISEEDWKLLEKAYI
jgi:diketogulonate reductase-like aldo/keto reductase